MATSKSANLTSLFYKKSETKTKTEITNEITAATQGKMDSSDYDTVTLSVTFEDDTTATYQLVKYIGGS